MRYENIVKGTFLARPNRFIAHVSVNGKDEIVLAENATQAVESIHHTSGEDGFSLEHILSDTASEDTMLERIMLKNAIGHLSQREATVIHLRYFHGLTQQRVARVLNVSQVQVSRIEKKALAKLKHLLE